MDTCSLNSSYSSLTYRNNVWYSLLLSKLFSSSLALFIKSLIIFMVTLIHYSLQALHYDVRAIIPYAEFNLAIILLQ